MHEVGPIGSFKWTQATKSNAGILGVDDPLLDAMSFEVEIRELAFLM